MCFVPQRMPLTLSICPSIIETDRSSYYSQGLSTPPTMERGNKQYLAFLLVESAHCFVFRPICKPISMIPPNLFNRLNDRCEVRPRRSGSIGEARPSVGSRL